MLTRKPATPRTISTLYGGVLGFAFLTTAIRCLAAGGDAGVPPGPAPAASAAPAPDSTATSNPSTGVPVKGLHFALGPANGCEMALHAALGQDRRIYGDGKILIADAVPLASYQMNRSPRDGDLEIEARFSSYYYMIKAGSRLAYTVTLRVDSTTGELRLASVGITPPTIAVDALDTLGKSEQVLAGNYEARLIRTGGSPTGLVGGTDLIWLKSAPGGTDLFYYPLQANAGGAVNGPPPPKLYTLPEYVALLQAQAQRNVDRSDALKDTFAENRRKAIDGQDTAIGRLKALSAALADTLAEMKQAPPDIRDDFAATMSDIARMQAGVASGLAAHPEANSLASHAQGLEYARASLGDLWFLPDGFMEIGADEHLQNAATSLRSGLNGFIGDPRIGRPTTGEIGGDRDVIMGSLFVTIFDLGTENLAIRSNLAVPRLSATRDAIRSLEISTATALSAGLNSPGRTGSIAGRVVRPDDHFAAFVFVKIMMADSPSAKIEAIPGPSGATSAFKPALRFFPATFADESGFFVIKNLPPGKYMIAVGDNRPIIEVNEGAESKLPEALKLSPPRQGGRGAGSLALAPPPRP